MSPTLIKREYDYALRICAYLAGQSDGEPVPVSRLADLLFLTRPVIQKIVFRLRKHQLVDTVQGRYGGLLLKRPAEEISIYDVLLAMGYDSSLNECLTNPHICPLRGYCRFHLYYLEAEKKIIDEFKSTYISEFILTDRELQKIAADRDPAAHSNT